MRIRRVTVTKLFGIFDHDIELNADERITILSGPNGYGKTILLRMIDSFLRGRYDIFRRVPFESFQVTFEDGQFLRIDHDKSVNRLLDVLLPGSALIITSAREEGHYRPFYQQSPPGVSPSAWGVVQAVIANHEPLDYENKDIPDWLRDVVDSANVRIIETQRLDTTTEVLGERSPRNRAPTVLRYSADLVERIERLLASYAARSQELDRTFPSRLLQQTVQPLTATELRDKLAAIEDKRARLTELGFLAREQQIELPALEAVQQKLDVLSVHVADVEQKLAVFDEMAAKVELLTRIVNDLFLYKHLRIDAERGFVFTSATGHRIEPDNLSSGEQHQLVLLYELLFQSPQGSLVLIDEPEISLHAAWQERFLDDLKEMVALSKFDVLVATHSAEIIGAHWDLVVELRGPEGLPAHPPAAEQAS